MANAVSSITQLCWMLFIIFPFVQCQLSINKFGGNGNVVRDRFALGSSFGNGNPFQNGGSGEREPKKSQDMPSRQNRPFAGNQQQEQGRQEIDPENMPQSIAAGRQLTPAVPSPTNRATISNLPPAVNAEDRDKMPSPGTSTFTPPPPLSMSSTQSIVSTAHSDIPTVINSVDWPPTLIATSMTLIPPAILTPLVPSASSTAMSVTTALPKTISATPSSISPSNPSSTSPGQNQTPAPTPAFAQESQPMNSSTRAGIGIGVTLSIVSIAAIAGIFLYRRRRNRRHARTDIPPSSRGFGSFGGFLLLNRDKSSSQPSDQEWIIESAEKVEIVRGASARTLSRSDSRSRVSATPNENVGVLKVGMTIMSSEAEAEARRERVGNLYNAALTSNPPSLPEENRLNPSVSTKPPLNGGADAGAGGVKKGSWPLDD
ncbi:hypothetical protein B0J11DRAFT_500678 [Dendryphion nanum]|uniref:Uncharacterized protein n=1 Tax=Dendryphion nanum TaxID=256645 RepID=A0A9P9EJ69_9PLEO|nr:hypothetical protein B0J11DRAFT_500678 [Dendryphion nanum]